MFAIGNNELSGLPVLGKTVTCWICGQEHAVEYGETIGEDGKRQPDNLLAFFKCGERSYLCGVKGKQLKKPQENIQHLDEYNRPVAQKIDHAAVGREYANNLLGEPAVSKCLHAMADEIELLRGYRDEAESAAAIAHLLVDKWRLTDAERSLLEMLADHPVTHEIMPNEVATLRGLLERTKQNVSAQ